MNGPLRIQAGCAAELAGDLIHLWIVRTDIAEEESRQLLQCLTESERRKAERFRFARDRTRSIAARGKLRQLLGAYAGLDPPALAFLQGSGGKPRLADAAAASGLSFNVSHSGDLAAIAIARAFDVGVDIEELDAGTDHEQLAQTFCTPAEQAWLAGLPGAARAHAVHRLWTIKEATSKAEGSGVSLPFADMSVEMQGGRVLAVEVSGPERATWFAVEVEVSPGYACAVASRRRCMEVVRMPGDRSLG